MWITYVYPNFFFIFWQLHLPMHANLAGSELTKEPFRWDERLFALLLRLPGTPGTLLDKGSVPAQPVQSDAGITAMCEVTGGMSTSILFQSLFGTNLCNIYMGQWVGKRTNYFPVKFISRL